MRDDLLYPNFKSHNLAFFMKMWDNINGYNKDVIKMAMTKRLYRQYSNELINIEEMIPENHFLRVIDKYFDWNFVYEEVEKIIKCNEEVNTEEVIGEK